MGEAPLKNISRGSEAPSMCKVYVLCKARISEHHAHKYHTWTETILVALDMTIDCLSMAAVSPFERPVYIYIPDSVERSKSCKSGASCTANDF